MEITRSPFARPVVPADTDSGRKATRREWIGLGVIALPCMPDSPGRTVRNLAVPAISTDLKAAVVSRRRETEASPVRTLS